MKVVIEEHKSYNEIDAETQNKIKDNNSILVCLSANQTEHPSDFRYIVYDGYNKAKAKFIELEDAIEYAEFLSKKGA